jgi:hypothetical protein
LKDAKSSMLKKYLQIILQRKQRPINRSRKTKSSQRKALKEFENAATTASGLKYIVLQGSGNKQLPLVM